MEPSANRELPMAATTELPDPHRTGCLR